MLARRDMYMMSFSLNNRNIYILRHSISDSTISKFNEGGIRMNTKLLAVFLLLFAAILVAGCTPTATTEDEDDNLFDFTDIEVDEDDTMSTDEDVDEEEEEEVDEEEEEVDESKASFTIEAVEGELVKIPVKAVDPDGDFLDYMFDDPFNEKGLWQTELGDEGKYLVKVSVTDGKLTTSDFVLIDLARANRPPTIECEDEIDVEESETVELDCNIFDVDGDVVLVAYDGWMKAETKDTDFGDAGTYTVIVKAKDQEGESTKEITINVLKKNRAPVIESLDDITVMETETIELSAIASDPDGDDVELKFSKPFNDDGEWETNFGDAGTYEVTVVASDGDLITEETITVVVERKNRAPVLKEIEPISVKEGETITIDVDTFDPDGDDVIISYSGWMESAEKETSFNDAHPDGCEEKGCTAEYTVTIQASDGVLSVTQDVMITVEDVNRPPEFLFG